MKRRKVLYLLGLSAVSGGLAIACGGQQPVANNPSPTPGAASPSPAAASGQELLIYSGRNEKLIGPLVQRFQEETGIRAQVRYGDTAELAATILEEGNNSPADVFFAQDAGALGALQKANRTKPLPDSVLNRVDGRFRSDDGQWVGVSGRARVLDYNTQLVQQQELPKSIWELTDAKWQGKVGWAPTNGSFQSFVTALRLIEGDEKTLQWLQAMKANGAKDYGKNTAIVEALGRGEISLGLVNNYYLYQFKKDDANFPVAHHYMPGDAGSMVNVAGVAMVNTTDRENEARTFIEYLLKNESQNYFAQETNEYPLVQGITPPQEQIALDQLNPPKIDLSDLNDLNGTLALLEKAQVL